MKRSPDPSTTSSPLQGFLILHDLLRPARLIPDLGLLRPAAATVDQDGYLRWTWKLTRHLEAPPSDLCFRFAALADGSPEQIRRFAARWGPLWLEPGVNQEPIELWLQYAQLARALLRFAADRLMGGKGRPEDWDTICKSIASESIDRTAMRSAAQTAVGGHAVNKWFGTARSHGIVRLVDQQLQIRPYAGFLFGILITQIAHATARSDQMAVCSGCNDPFVPARPLSRGVRQYCKRCRKKKIPRRDAARAWRQRGREKLGDNPR
jgi:hypothetical protein